MMNHFLHRLTPILFGCALFTQANVHACVEHTEDGQAIQKLLSDTYDQPQTKVRAKPMVIVGDYALLDWMQGEHGGRALLRKTKGQWRLVACGGDGFKRLKTLQAAGIPAEVAQSLIAQLKQEEADLTPEQVQRFSSFGAHTVMMDANNKPNRLHQ